jgi:hypothetical protein
MSSVARFFQKVIFFAGVTGGGVRSLEQLSVLRERLIWSEYDKAIVRGVQPDSSADA